MTIIGAQCRCRRHPLGPKTNVQRAPGTARRSGAAAAAARPSGAPPRPPVGCSWAGGAPSGLGDSAAGPAEGYTVPRQAGQPGGAEGEHHVHHLDHLIQRRGTGVEAEQVGEGEDLSREALRAQKVRKLGVRLGQGPLHQPARRVHPGDPPADVAGDLPHEHGVQAEERVRLGHLEQKHPGQDAHDLV
eukprot:CAMPEP_0194743752 /NCGR_PEP_ID=MMETSP0296-20130528/100481_1 /TAXON_ID=39354 /ORGANISM="Heterosigma akashiwo, Strain CCMP2393" /LENGTH=187 /DNA_ID=CAMNT_0039655807 /DNA_START=742 /DNA_END=1302 /DNA_ORIENTATION=-